MIVVLIITACTPSEGPESIPLPTSPDTTTTTTTTTVPPSTTSSSTSSTGPSTTLAPELVRYEATIRRTTDGVPHVEARNLGSLAFGQGYASGEDHACTLIDQVLKIRGERAAALGPGETGENVESDFAWRAIGLYDRARADYDEAPRNVVTVFEGFAAGWNAHLDATGVDELTGWCAGAGWVRPVQPVEVYAYARSLALLASGARLVDFIPSAQPPGVDEPLGRAETPAALTEPVVDTDAAGSNAWAVGRDRAVGHSGGLLVANPHFPWEGELRFDEIHLVIPGRLNVYGAQLLGTPGIGIGFTDGVAWSHTVSAGKRFTAYTLDLDPGSPTSYLVDGEPRPMTPTDHTIDILRPDGSIDSETRTLWSSEYGPMLDFPGIGWTDSTAVTYRDANIDNDEFVEQYLAMIDVEDLDELIAVHRTYQGVPLFNTVATGRGGRIWYADTAASPNLTAEAEQLFRERLRDDDLTRLAWDNGVMLLDGSDSRFRWQVQRGARDPGLVPWAEMPRVRRTDYLFNANDSYWVPSAKFTLDGPYSIVHGEQGTPQSLRTRQNAAVLSDADPFGLSGEDGLFTGPELRDAVFDNGSYNAFRLRRWLVRACRATPTVDLPELLADDGTVELPAATVDLTAACDVLDEWDGRYDLDRAGPILWREAMSRFTEDELTTTGPLWGSAFDPADPTRTPAEPAEDPTRALDALARAVQVVESAGFAVDATLGAAQFTERSGERIAIHGGTGVEGVTNIVTWSDDSGSSSEPAPVRGDPIASGSEIRSSGYPVNAGTSFVMTVDYTRGAPRAWAILTYGQSDERTSDLFDQQTIRFSEKNWRQVAFTTLQILDDANLEEQVVQGG